MAAYYTEYDLPDHKSGDTFIGIIFRMRDENGEPIDLEGASINLHTLSPSEQHLTTEDLQIGLLGESSSGILNEIEIKEQIIDWVAGEYEYEITITFPDDRVRTYIQGTWLIED